MRGEAMLVHAWWRALLVLGGATMIAGCGGGGSGSTGTVASAAPSVVARYAAPGPSTVVRTTASDASGLSFTIYHPAQLATDGVASPVIAYGVGTLVNCTAGLAQAFGEHLASWGYIVTCPNVSASGSGQELLRAIRFMLSEHARPGSLFEGHLDTVNIGVAGHSQGATGAVNANAASAGVIRSTVTLALVDLVWHGDPPQLPEARGPLFLISGCDDTFVTEQDNYFNAAPTPTAKACKRGGTHASVMADSLGYLTAWFQYTLRGDPVARSAFVDDGATAAELGRDPAWSGWRSKNLP